MISKNTKINIMNMLKRGEAVPRNEENTFILFDLMNDGFISMVDDSIYLTHFGHKELSEYDPFLQVNINNQLADTPYGEA